ncbi:MAG: alpha/beta family hydrolase [Cyanobacteriota bacterium]|nr:alpha/beta family hydrolase [Cyanobacteriota bacterium]
MSALDFNGTLDLAAGRVALGADLVAPTAARGLVLFAHGSGSGRRSPRNRGVASRLQAQGLATLLVDLLTPAEARVLTSRGSPAPDLEDQADRLVALIDHLPAPPLAALAELPLGLFGASTGAAVALMVAALRPERVRALVSRGGRPDLAGASLAAVQAPTLLIVGGNDPGVLQLNRLAADHLAAPWRLLVIPQAGHLFEERGCLQQVAGATATWFLEHLSQPQQERLGRCRSEAQYMGPLEGR